jgi:hypothetical protein
MRLPVRTGRERTTFVAVVPVQLNEGSGPEMDMGRGIRAGRGANALELIVGQGPVPPA